MPETSHAAPEPFDVLVIGGGPAGATAATYCAMQGHRTAVLERDEFPRHRVGESLLPSMMPILEDFGLIDEVEALGFPRKTGGTFIWGQQREPWEVLFSNNPFLPYPYAYHVDRAVFDQVLLRHAERTGVAVHQGWNATAPIVEGGRVVGVKAGQGRDAPQTEWRARVVIDASGPSAVVGRALTTREYDEKMRQVAFYTYFRDVDGPKGVREGHVLIESNPWGWMWYIPMTGALGDASVGLVSGQEFKEEYGAMGADAFFQRALDRAPYMRELLGPRATVCQPTRAISDWAYACDRMAGEGFFLAGDAAAFLDPLLSTGASMAMLAGYSSSVCANSILRDPAMEDAAITFYNRNYRRMWEVTRDFLHYFYAGNATAHPDDIFWKARGMLKLSDNVGAAQAFCFLVNTIPANPHPALDKQIHMYLQFMDNLDHPTEAMAGDEGLQARVHKHEGWGTTSAGAITDGTVLMANGELERSWVIDGATHQLAPTRGITYDQERPVFSSTSSWLLGRNLHPLDDEGWALLGAMDGERTWGQVVAAAGLGADAASAALERLCAEQLVLARADEGGAAARAAS